MTLSDIDTHWPEVEPGLRYVQRKTQAHWTPQQIREACRNKQAFLFLVPEGFVVLRPVHDPSGVSVDVQVAYGRGQNLIERYQPDIEQLARAIGATRLTFNSPRKGFARLPGWQVSTVVYERSINHG